MKKLINRISQKISDENALALIVIVIPLIGFLAWLGIETIIYIGESSENLILYNLPLSYYAVAYIVSFFILNILSLFDDVGQIRGWVETSWFPVLNTTVSLYFVGHIIIYYIVVAPIKKAGNLIDYHEELIKNIKEKI